MVSKSRGKYGGGAKKCKKKLEILPPKPQRSWQGSSSARGHRKRRREIANRTGRQRKSQQPLRRPSHFQISTRKTFPHANRTTQPQCDRNEDSTEMDPVGWKTVSQQLSAKQHQKQGHSTVELNSLAQAQQKRKPASGFLSVTQDSV